MRDAGVEVATTAVGDRYVLQALREREWALGGEQSGHIIDMGFVPSGDGIAAALLTLEALGGRRPGRARRDGEAPAAARQRAPRRPRRARGRRRGRRRRRRSASTRRWPAAAACSCASSGTEPLVRVMVEAPDGGGGRRGLRPPRRRGRGPRRVATCDSRTACESCRWREPSPIARLNPRSAGRRPATAAAGGALLSWNGGLSACAESCGLRGRTRGAGPRPRRPGAPGVPGLRLGRHLAACATAGWTPSAPSAT